MRLRTLTIRPCRKPDACFAVHPGTFDFTGALTNNQSSTSAFQGSWAQPQLASQVAIHAVVAGRPAVHTGLSGDSAAFDALGRQLALCTSTYRGTIVVDVPLGSVTTFYQRLGN
jgi:apolipoprotein N-acyltransferase